MKSKRAVDCGDSPRLNTMQCLSHGRAMVLVEQDLHRVMIDVAAESDAGAFHHAFVVDILHPQFPVRAFLGAGKSNDIAIWDDKGMPKAIAAIEDILFLVIRQDRNIHSRIVFGREYDVADA